SRADFCTLRGMSLTAFALVVAAACLHALWNLAAKRVSGNVGVLWLGLCRAGVLLAPFALPSAVQSFDPAGLPYLVATGMIHAAHGSLRATPGCVEGEPPVGLPPLLKSAPIRAIMECPAATSAVSTGPRRAVQALRLICSAARRSGGLPA